MDPFDPQAGIPLPEDYLEHCRSARRDLRVGRAAIFAQGKNPEVLGRAGEENFWRSILIGRLDTGQTVLLTCEQDGWGQNKRWEYRVAGLAEWTVFARFPTLADLLSFLKSYPGVPL